MQNNTPTDTEEDEEYLKYVPWEPGEPSPTHAPDALAFINHLQKKQPPEQKASPVGKSRALLTCIADVQSKKIDWLWPGRIALGKLTLIAGDPGLGKSLLTTALAAHISKGMPWPIDKEFCPTGDVVLLSAEDDPADTIRPRLDAAGADCNRVHILRAIQDKGENGKEVQRMFSFKRDVERLEEVLSSLPECRLLAIDPISAYLDGTDSNNNSDIRGLFAPLAELAERHNVAILAISHLNKSAGGSAMYRTMGSLAFVAAARAVFVVTKDQDNPERRLVLPVKINIARDSAGLAYSVVTAENGAPVIAWEKEPVNITAAEALAPAESSEERTNTDWAIELLEEILANGPLSVAEIRKEAQGAGVSKKCLERAKVKLKIEPKKVGYKEGWVWALPGHEDTPKDEEHLPKKEGVFDVAGNLQDEKIEDF